MSLAALGAAPAAKLAKAAGATWSDVVKLNGYMVKMNADAVNLYREVRSRYLDPKRMPASTLIGVALMCSNAAVAWSERRIDSGIASLLATFGFMLGICTLGAAALGANFALLQIATNESFTDKSGERRENTEWHKVVVWGRSAESCATYLAKGRPVCVEGRLQTRAWDELKARLRIGQRIVGQQEVRHGALGGGVRFGQSAFVYT